MQNLDLPILVVDDAKFSSLVVSRALTSAGYRDVRIANNAADALALIAQRAVSVLIADWLMPEMDGLELADQVRTQDKLSNHYTYIILLTAREGVGALATAFDRGVDDFIYKSDMSKQLIPRIYAAGRLVERQGSLLHSNTLLEAHNRTLEDNSMIELDTGLYNKRYAQDRLSRCLRHTESRGGATGYLLCGIRNWQALTEQHNPAIMAELSINIAKRLSHLIRPLDALCRIGENEFALIAYFENSEQCTTNAFRRVYDGINHKAIKTNNGYISVEASMVLCTTDANPNTPSAEGMEKAANQGLLDAYETNHFAEVRLPARGQAKASPLASR